MKKTANSFYFFLLSAYVVVGCAFLIAQPARAEFGDVVINNFSDDAGIRPVIFPHWFHRARFRCNICHTKLGFEFKAGGNKINMLKIISGEYCGACHDGSVAWPVDNCDLCHSAKPGTPTQVHKNTLQTMIGGKN